MTTPPPDDEEGDVVVDERMKKRVAGPADDEEGRGGERNKEEDDGSSPTTTPNKSPPSASAFDPFHKLREAYSSSLDVAKAKAEEETSAGGVVDGDTATAFDASTDDDRRRRKVMEGAGANKKKSSSSRRRKKKKNSANEGERGRRRGRDDDDDDDGRRVTVGGNSDDACTAVRDDGAGAGEDCDAGDVVDGGARRQQRQGSEADAADNDDDPFLRLRESYSSSVELMTGAGEKKADDYSGPAGVASATDDADAADVDKKENETGGRDDDGANGGTAKTDGRENKRHKRKKSKRKHRDERRSKSKKEEKRKASNRDRGDVEMRPLVDFDGGVDHDDDDYDDDDDLELAIFGSRPRRDGGGNDDGGGKGKFSMTDYGFDVDVEPPDDVWLIGLKVACVAAVAVCLVVAIRTPDLSDRLHHAVRGFMPRDSVVDYYKENDNDAGARAKGSFPAGTTTPTSPSSPSSGHAAGGTGSEAVVQDDENNRPEVKIPERYRDTLAELYEPYDDLTDTPIYWHIAKCAGTTFQHYVDHCLGLVDASQIGITDGHEEDKKLQIYQHDDGGLFVNVDTTTPLGISRAKSMGLAESGFADVIFTSLIYDAARLFTPQHRGRMFALFRHPVDRAVSLYYHLRDAKWEETYDPLLKGLTIEEFAKRSQTEHNWMTRFLTGVDNGNLYEKHLDTAKEILRTRCLVGLVSELEVSLDRFQRYFGWTLEGEGTVGCHWEHVKTGYNVRDHPPLERDTEAYMQLERRNYMDMRLYEYVEQLFKDQSQLF